MEELQPEVSSVGAHPLKCTKDEGSEIRKCKVDGVKLVKKWDKATTSTAIELAKKPNLMIADVTCPVCWQILYEPTTFPCNHSMCMSCFLIHKDVTSLQCPVCRRRFSIWSRTVKKDNGFLDHELWERLKREFPEAVRARENGTDYEESTIRLQQRSHLDGVVCQEPGVIYEELKSLLKPHEEDLEIERQRSEIATNDLIKKLQEEEIQIIAYVKKRDEEDLLLAKKLQKELNGVDDFTIRRSGRERKPTKRYETEF